MNGKSVPRLVSSAYRGQHREPVTQRSEDDQRNWQCGQAPEKPSHWRQLLCDGDPQSTVDAI
jgi:hypothetical protein